MSEEMDWREELSSMLEETERLARQLEAHLASAADGSDPVAQKKARERLERRSRESAERLVEEFRQKGVI